MLAILKQAVRRLTFTPAQRLWIMALRLYGMLLPPRPLHWQPTGQDRVLVVAPHPDDETLGCGGTIALHVEAGDQVVVLVVTDGGSSKAGELTRAEMALARRAEVRRAAAVLGDVELEQLLLPENNWTIEQLRERISVVLDRLKPTLIYSTSCVDYHSEHVKVAEAVAESLIMADRKCRVRIYEVQVPLTPALVNVSVSIEETLHRKWRALKEFGTQWPSFGWARRHERYLRAAFGSRGAVEVFWELSAQQYGELMNGYRRELPAGTYSTFRGMKQRPYSDGMTWLAGQRARNALKRLAEAREEGHISR